MARTTRSNAILGLEVKDFKTVRFFKTELPETGVVTIQGRNGEGKSAITEFLELATRGKQFGAFPGARTGSRPDLIKPVRKGAKESTGIITFKGFELRVVVDEEGDVRVRLRDKTGGSVDTQALLRNWINAWSFNADYFRLMVNAGREEVWRDMLLSGARIEITEDEAKDTNVTATSGPQVLEELSREIDTATEFRRVQNVRVRDLKAAVEEITVPADAPAKKPDFERISAKYNKLVDEKAAIDRQVKAYGEQFGQVEREIAQDEALLASLNQQVRDAINRCETRKAKLSEIRAKSEKLEFTHDAELAEASRQVKEMSDLAAKWETVELKRKKEAELLEANSRAERAQRALTSRENFLDTLLNRIDLGSRLLRYDGKQLLIRDGREWRPYTDANEALQRIASYELAATRVGEVGLLVAKGDGLTKETFIELDRIAREQKVLVVLEVASDELKKLGDKDVFLTLEAG